MSKILCAVVILFTTILLVSAFGETMVDEKYELIDNGTTLKVTQMWERVGYYTLEDLENRQVWWTDYRQARYVDAFAEEKASCDEHIALFEKYEVEARKLGIKENVNGTEHP